MLVSFKNFTPDPDRNPCYKKRPRLVPDLKRLSSLEFKRENITDAFLDSRRMAGDPATDAIITALSDRSGRGGIQEFFHMLISRIELPVDELPDAAKIFIKNTSLPPWTDHAKIRLSEDLFQQHGSRYLLVLYFKALPVLYACANGARVLATTGRLAHHEEDMKIFARRVAETGQFLIYTLRENSLTSGRAIDTILKVRLIHASIRSFVRQRGWDQETLGVPVNQEDLAITLQTFSTSVIEGLEQTGIDLTDIEKDAVMHHWKVTGSLLGIGEELMPNNYADGKFLLNRILSRQAAASGEGRLLTKALVIFAQRHLPARFKNAPQLLIRYFSPEIVSRSVNLNSQLPWYLRYLPAFLVKLFNITAKLTDYNPNIKKAIDELSGAIVWSMVNYFNNYKEAPFFIPDELKNKWLMNKSFQSH